MSDIIVKITIIDKEFNEYKYQQPKSDVDVFLEMGIVYERWGKRGDITILLEETTQEQIDALNYLCDTDWYVIRKVDIGTEIPSEILNLREAARALL